MTGSRGLQHHRLVESFERKNGHGSAARGLVEFAWADAMREAARLRSQQPGASLSNSVSFFTIPKPFEGHIATIQRNAIQSWKRLAPACEIILCGDEAGVAETAEEFDCVHLPDLARNEYGTPFLHSAFEQAKHTSSRELLCYINTDIIVLNDFMRALPILPRDAFLAVGRRWDLDVTEPLDFAQKYWQEQLRDRAIANGSPHSLWGIDYFIFPREGVIDRMPPFVVGRPGWDNWMIFHVRKMGVPVIDVSSMVRVIHQNHDYNHVPMRWGERWVGPEAQRQIQLLTELMGGRFERFAIADATHELTKKGPVRVLTLRSLRRSWTTLPALHPRFRLAFAALNPIAQIADWIWQAIRSRRD